jgi:hypothetical protein
VQIVFIGTLDFYGRNFADAEWPVTRHIDGAINLRRVAFAAALRNCGADLIDDDALVASHFTPKALARNRLLVRHEAGPAFLFDGLRHCRTKIVRRRARHRLLTKAADAIELGFAEPAEQ